MKNKVIAVSIIAFVGLVLFILFAAEPVHKQVFFEPVSVTDIGAVENKVSAKTEVRYPFVSHTFFGFFNESGQVVFSKEQPPYFSVSDSLWTAYDFIDAAESTAPELAEPVQAKIIASDGTELCSVAANGLIYVRNDRIFVFLPSGNSLCEYDKTGKLLWMYSMSGIITAFDCTSELLVLGASDGSVACLDKNGKEKFSFYPGGSTVQIIYGLAVSENGKYIGCVCGLEQQRFMLIEINDYHKTVFHTFLKNSIRLQVTMLFDKQSRYLFSETAEGLVILDCANFHFTQTKVRGHLRSYAVETNDRTFALLTQEERKGYITAFDARCRQVGQTDFDCSSASMIQTKNNFYLIADDKLLTFQLKKQ